MRHWIAIAVVAGSFGAGWLAQSWRLEAQLAQQRTELANVRTDHKEALLRQSAASLETYTRMELDKDAAIKNAQALAARNALDAAGARAERDGLRDDLASVPARIAAATDAAVREYAAAITIVFEQCAARITDLAHQADGHAADVGLMREAWPTNKAE